ncbi:MAG: alkaline phosphatase family protein [bacterium]|nr:alkaline phosphatase family protein [bacterium]
MSNQREKLLILALDGFDPDFFTCHHDKLPHLSRWADEGSLSPLTSTIPPMTFPAWTTFLTGVNPGKHGIFDFTARIPGELRCRFINSSHRQAPTFLKVASQEGLRVGCVGIPCTYPPEELSGFQISGFDTPLPSKADSSFIYPPALAAKIESELGGVQFGNFNESHISKGWHLRVLQKLLEGIQRKTALSRLLLEEFPLDVFVLHVGETDTVGHHFWCFSDPKSPRYLRSKSGEVESAILQVYQAADRLAGEVAGLFKPTTVMVVSDHGMTGTSDRVIYLNRYLEQCGLLKFKKSDLTDGFISRGKRFGMRWIPYQLQQQVFRVAGGRLAGDIESRQRFGSINWEGTFTYSEELNYYPAVYLNLRGREPYGIIDEADRERWCDKVADALLAWIDPGTGSQVVAKVHRRENIYHGNHTHLAPDLILELHRPAGYVYALGRSSSADGKNPVRQMTGDEYVGFKGASMNGSHQPNGIFIFHHDSERISLSNEISLMDVAPTVLSLFKLQVPSWMDGSNLLGSNEYRTGELDVASATRNYSAEEEAILYSRLLELGYLG